jgi:hypothetical protein
MKFICITIVVVCISTIILWSVEPPVFAQALMPTGPTNTCRSEHSATLLPNGEAVVWEVLLGERLFALQLDSADCPVAPKCCEIPTTSTSI